MSSCLFVGGAEKSLHGNRKCRVLGKSAACLRRRLSLAVRNDRPKNRRAPSPEKIMSRWNTDIGSFSNCEGTQVARRRRPSAEFLPARGSLVKRNNHRQNNKRRLHYKKV